MKIVNQTCKSFIQEPGIEGIYKQIELAGRTCYKSTDKLTEGSAKPFVERLINSSHLAMLEHATVYLCRVYFDADEASWNEMFLKYHENPYSKVVVRKEADGTYMAITTNYRVIIEHSWEDDLKYLCEPGNYHEKRYTLYCTTALHCYKDLTRHRTMSFAIESTRYCNYTKDKFGGQLTFIKPTWCRIEPGEYKWKINDSGCPEPDGWSFSAEGIEGADIILMVQLGIIEYAYNTVTTEYNWKAQQAAEILPQCVKGDMVISGFESDWKHLLDLRFLDTTGASHPMVKELTTLMLERLREQGFEYQTEN